MQYVFFKKAGAFSRRCALKVTFQSVRLLLTVSYRKKIAEQAVLLAPNNFVGELPCPPGSRAYARFIYVHPEWDLECFRGCAISSSLGAPF